MYLDKFKLTGKVAVVTGAARGHWPIGRGGPSGGRRDRRADRYEPGSACRLDGRHA